MARNRPGAQHCSPTNPGIAERGHRRERRGLCCDTAAGHLDRARLASYRFERPSNCPSRPSSPQRIFCFEPPPALTERAASVSQSKQLLRVRRAGRHGCRAPMPHNGAWTDLQIWKHRRCPSTHRGLWLPCVQASTGGADHDPFHASRAGAAPCRRSNFGPAIGCSGARFVNPDSQLRQVHSPAETGTVSISPARAMSISCSVGDAARLRAATARRNSGTARNFSTQDTSAHSRQQSSGISSDPRHGLSISWMLVRARVITSLE